MATLVQLSIGSIVGGDFRIVEPLSAGGMGAVYLAEQLSTGKSRALKVMHRRLVQSPKSRERFVQEARVGALIRSDHVVEVIAAGIEDKTGLPWIAMELLEGEDLADFMARRERVSSAELLSMLRQLCHALGAGHDAGVVHRDIKPENVFVARSHSVTAPTFIKVLDFGIAKVAAQAELNVTASLGSPAWMAPEQSKTGADITPAADTWSLGLLVFWMLTGHCYWQAANDPDGSMSALLREVLFEPLEPASKRAAGYGCAERLPAGFDEWFARCLVRDPAGRFAHASELFEALEPVLAPEAAAPRPVPFATGKPIAHRTTLPAGSEFDPGDPQAVERVAGAPMGGGTLLGLQPEPTKAQPASAEADKPAAPPEPTDAQPVTAMAGKPAAPPVAPLPSAGTASPIVTSATYDDEPIELPLKHRRGWLIGALVVMVAAIGLVVMAMRGSKPEDRSGPPASTTVSDSAAATTAAGTATPLSTAWPSAEPTMGVSETGLVTSATGQAEPAGPMASTEPDSAGTAASSTTEPPPSADSAAPSATAAAAGHQPFDRAAARQAVHRQGGIAQGRCRQFSGPRVVSATIAFDPTGTVRSVAIHHASAPPHSTVACVRRVLWGTQIEPYAGGVERISVSVALD